MKSYPRHAEFMRRERLYLEDIIAAADAIAQFTGAQDLDSFEANLMLRSAVVHQLTIIGEAATSLPPEIRDRHLEVPWGIRGFRNIIVHNYFGIDWEEVWRSAGSEGAGVARSDRRYPSHGVPRSMTCSCYDPAPDGRPCGQCDACLLRAKGFQEAGIEDR